MTTSYQPGPNGEQPGYWLPAPPKRKRRWMWVILVAFLAVLCGFGGIVAIGTSAHDKDKAPAVVFPSDAPVSKTAPVKKSAPAPAAAPTIDDGVWQVGTDVKAGRYRLKTAPEDGCYWKITKDDAGDDIVANDLPTGGHPQVTLKTGQFFSTRDCGVWTKIS